MQKKDNNQINDICKKMATDILELQTQTYNLKIEFQKELLEKVHPIGSYYCHKKAHHLKKYLVVNGNLYMGNLYFLQIVIILLIVLGEKKNIL